MEKQFLITNWPSLAACQNGDPDALFVQGAEQNIAKRICRVCPVKIECLADALDNKVEFGVWGGMTERERRALLKRHGSKVTSWRRLFEEDISRKNRGQGIGPQATDTTKAVGSAAVDGARITESQPVDLRPAADIAQQAFIPGQRIGEESTVAMRPAEAPME